MTNYEKGRYRTGPPDLPDYVLRLEKRIKDLETASRLGYSSVNGPFVIREGPFKVIPSGEYFEGDLTILEITKAEYPEKLSTEPGWVFRRNSGQEVVGVFGNGSGQYYAVKDFIGNTIFSDDLFSHFGIGRPWLPIPFYDDTLPTSTTTSASFDQLQIARYSVQSPYIYMLLFIHASDGTTAGEVQVTLSDNQVGDVITVTAGTSAQQEFGPYNITELAHFGDLRDLKVNARRTAGAGTIGVRVLSAYGRQT